jgi:hypothetical protein
MAVTDVLLTLGVTLCLVLLVTDRIEWAGVAAGLAASAKYPGVLLVVPLLVAGYGRWRRTAIALALAAVAFVVTSPFVLVHAGAAGGDVSRVNRLAHEGWLGFEDDPVTPAAFSLRLWETVGPVVLVALVGIAIAVRRRERRDLVLLSFVAVYCLSLLPIEAHFDRYVLPLVPVVCVLAGATRPLAVAALVCCVVPLWWSAADTRALTGRHVIRLELPGPGRPFDPRRSVAALRAGGARWLVVSGSVTDRVLAAADRYPREAAFYRSLETLTPAFAVGRSGRDRPWLRVYRIYP